VSDVRGKPGASHERLRTDVACDAESDGTTAPESAREHPLTEILPKFEDDA
jgi:hypothetical protein